ncbi:CCA-tRNA nucleotidyltransferase [Caulobacter phage C1]|nr:CCA-tRNA nucleotidyltransferase [Caulobacter phage C1]UTU08530.1 CCA-tRNA nucleotidyltransferase [Caulobacter phage C2]UTU09046.1 CCA-tRNA nucleotidyltransferase [Caulobacter phage J4]UTU09606.1 CCA-tRNA nucleotidyltransferase [Caulobacter phage BL47]UTU10163.1 CCA-tRNA nucleotidyltransferase [Caulobacter phage RB23]WGN97197.1 CCA tRNA nucleotidyltransferase [Bertelyvirus sp.]
MLIPDDLRILRAAFEALNRDIRFVGGWVRAYMLGEAPKDIDLCTDASIEEMKEIAEACDVVLDLYPTGEEHGTMTFRLDSGLYEITCLRQETAHDGRRADCVFGQDWDADLARRDLTINAMAMDFDGRLYDPHGGAVDLKAGRVRFVGDPVDRMREDYLRILRWLRFHARYSKGPLDFDARNAAEDLRDGLGPIKAVRTKIGYTVSRERVWDEMKKIIAGPRSAYILFQMVRMRLDEPLGFDGIVIGDRYNAVVRETADPIVRLVALFEDTRDIEALATDWKWSREERSRAIFLSKCLLAEDVDVLSLVLMGVCDKDAAEDICILREDADLLAYVRRWTPPEFPVKGQDLLDLGMKPGPQMGVHLASLRRLFADHRGGVTKEQLLATLRLEIDLCPS